MRTWWPRSSKGRVGRAGLGEPSTDIFEQPERSLLGEALGRPVGFCSAIVLVLAGGVFVANHFFLHMDRINDFALVAFFVGGGGLLSILLRSGDTTGTSQKRARTSRSAEMRDDLILEDHFQERGECARATGLAEPSPTMTPVPSAALIEPAAVRAAPDPADEEVATLQKALVHYAERGDFHGQGEVLRRLGHLAKARGHLKESREFYVNARSSFRKIDDHYAEAAVLLDLGQVLESLEEHDAASAAYRDANRALLDVAMNSGDHHNAIQAHAAD